MELKKGMFKQDNVEYSYYQCPKCKEEILDMSQLSKAAKQYRKLKSAKKIKFMKWGNSIAVRIAKDFIKDLNIKPGKEAHMVKEGKELKIILD